ncbi:MAG: choline dehydrogenase [Bacteroidota bacterium]|nr:choline dehydrogenase [Bacteroidota bacterium]MXW13911.1 choline dehydrogenase [Rhodothermaceae bacterium]MDE2644934.1 choline dehydrogenase [Bacteroidota bacterium]MXW32549.1 choline dehydrogenase [Rhodothermaceae bacterium]MXZ17122.1 choline dehydrogenase [Rhodothermaceae bacterium]
MKTSTESFDYVIVGAGAAGCVVAHRLAEDSNVRVLLLEAGPPDRSPLIHMPAGFAKLTGKNVNWCFKTVPQKHLNHREMHYPQGRTLGGSTSINAMIYIRGHRLDYEEWRDLGCQGWAYDDVLPYFKRSENNERFVDEFHGRGGPLNVADQVQSNPLSRAFVRSAQEVGIRYNPDLNGARQSGVSYYQVTQRNVRRESAATAFLRPPKTNLTILTGAVATRVLLENGRAIGIEYAKNKARVQVHAEREVILSGGAVNSPKLLLLSGIGPADELKPLGIQVEHDLPGVGKNFQDHMDVYLAAESSKPVSYNGHDRWNRAILHGIQYLLYKTGPVTASVCEAGCFLKSSPEVRSPDIQIHCLPAYVVDHGRMSIKGHGLTINTCNLRPRSIGSLKLRSNDPLEDPAIDPNFLDDPYDLKVSMEGFKWGRRILAAPSFQQYISREILPGQEAQSDEDIKAYIRKWSKNDYHPVGSCKMGTDDQAVVDLQLSVHGLESLRVIDASIMPRLISGNTQATSIMIGEKGAAMIKGEA